MFTIVLLEENASQSQQNYTIQMTFADPEKVFTFTRGSVFVNEKTKPIISKMMDMATHTYIEHHYELFKFTIKIYIFESSMKKLAIYNNMNPLLPNTKIM